MITGVSVMPYSLVKRHPFDVVERFERTSIIKRTELCLWIVLSSLEHEGVKQHSPPELLHPSLSI